MVDRVGLVSAVVGQANFAVKTGEAFDKAMTKALVLTLQHLPLEAVRAYPMNVKSEIAFSLRDVLAKPDLVKVSRLWEPKRKVDPAVTANDLADQLIELSSGSREPYVYPNVSLVDAQHASNSEKHALRYAIEELAALPDLKKFAGKWDGNDKALKAKTKKYIVERLVALLDGKVEPAPKPPKLKR